MSHRRFHWLEKVQVELAALGALAAVYFLVTPLLRPWDPAGPITYLPYGEGASLLGVALTVWVLAFVSGIVTASSRPEGALLVTLVGTGGFSLASPQMRNLLWSRGDSFSPVFLDMALELLVLSLVLLGAGILISLARRFVAGLSPRWMWVDPLVGAAPPDTAQQPSSRAIPGILGLIFMEPAWRTGTLTGRDMTPARLVTTCLACLGMTLVLSATLIVILMQSPERGQVLFALFASCTVSALVAHQVTPAPFAIATWLAPVMIGVFFYCLAAVSAVAVDIDAWAGVTLYARTVPLDWLSAGCGGAVLGFWISERVHELRFFEKQEEQLEKEGKEA